jgi:hypothetical protein
MVILLFVYAVNFNIFNELISIIPYYQLVKKIKFCRNTRIELVDLNTINLSKISLIFFAVFLSGCKHINYFYSDKKNNSLFFAFFYPKKRNVVAEIFGLQTYNVF